MVHPLVTVVIPIFNQAVLGIEAVESVCAQTYSNLQIIVVDDGSTDNSAETLAEHFGNRITILRQSNSGPSAAINAGLRAANGAFIMLMGGDDICTLDRVEYQLQALHEANCDIIFSRPLLIDSVGDSLADSCYPVFFRRIESPNTIFHSLFFEDNFLCAPSAMMKAEVINRVGMFHEGLIQLQDYDYWLRACGKSLSLCISDHRIVAYRRHAGNLSSEARTSAALAEIPYVLERTIDGAQPSSMRAAFKHILIPALDVNKPLSKFEKSMLLLAHPRAEVRVAGLAVAMDIFDDPIAKNEISSRDVDLFRYIYNSMDTN